MELELNALTHNNTWILIGLPPGRKALTSKQLYKTKFKPNGSIQRNKARLVIMSFERVKDRDCKHSFSAVPKLITVRLFIALAAAKDWCLHQLNINNPFLCGYIERRCTSASTRLLQSIARPSLHVAKILIWFKTSLSIMEY